MPLDARCPIFLTNTIHSKRVHNECTIRYLCNNAIRFSCKLFWFGDSLSIPCRLCYLRPFGLDGFKVIQLYN